MVLPDGSQTATAAPSSLKNAGSDQSSSSSPSATLRSYPVHKSTSLINLPSALNSYHPPRIRFSIDTDTGDVLSRNPVVGDADHVYSSGLRRIRQQVAPSSPIHVTHSLPGSRVGSISMSASPTLGACEDLVRFPTESLHSFSFAHQSDDAIHTRQNILKRSIEFMRDRLGWAGSNPMIASAQAKVEGDEEMVKMMELLQKANLLVGPDSKDLLLSTPMSGPATGPAMTSDSNPFDRNFQARNQAMASMPSSPLSPPQSDGNFQFTDEPGQMDPAESVFSSQPSSRSTTNESASTAKTSPPPTRRTSLKRTYTDTSPLSLQTKLLEALAQPYLVGETPLSTIGATPARGGSISGPTVHNHSNRYAPASQAIFTTTSSYPWTILAANDLACLVFGVTKAEVRKIGILEVVKEERREWLAEKLRGPGASGQYRQPSPPPMTSLQRALSKPKSVARKSRTEELYNIGRDPATRNMSNPHHNKNKSRGVILCGDVVPIQKRNGKVGAASLWVKEKRTGLIWVLEEINEDVVYLNIDENASCFTVAPSGEPEKIFGDRPINAGDSVARLLPGLPRREDDSGLIDFGRLEDNGQYTAKHVAGLSVPCTVEHRPSEHQLKVSSFPHIAGILVLSASSLVIQSSNSVFSSALFGQSKPAGLHVNELLPGFDRMLKFLETEDKIQLVDGIVVPEHSFRRTRAILALRDGKENAAAAFFRPTGLNAKHRDGGELRVDVQMRVVTSESDVAILDPEGSELLGDKSELVYALWVTYSRNHAISEEQLDPLTGLQKLIPETPPHQPSPGQTGTPILQRVDSTPQPENVPKGAAITRQLERVLAEENIKKPQPPAPKKEVVEHSQLDGHKKTVRDFVILEDMGQGAYGQVKLARYRKNQNKKVVLKYVTKSRILVDTWTRDRQLGTVPLEIHVLNYLRREDLRHPCIVEMEDFFEDDTNYYIEMKPHGLPGMDLYDYIELKVTMDEAECRSIFQQVAQALQHLHTKALVVHRDVKDENVVLDGEGRIKLIDFGSAAYIKNGPFDVFVGTIDYASPEVLKGKSYRGKEQDIWALGVLLYTIIYKENPFYNIDEIMDHDIRIPWSTSDDSIDLIKGMLNRDVEKRLTISQVLEHPWCTSQHNAVLPAPPPLDTISAQTQAVAKKG
ncbi:hypothetical protein EYR41_002446 [Orbilia oligospora]|uniref:non-specific serine/threonine protein kinase n=1 Tax=Orbilia oligospora TaxID=2813651 RepID=A0A7C8P822_ORBOL|nr:hypothetical protein TWF751_000715 [Orbilia oligospora]TGJ62467.1 hypothetical protein EYR41_002446 [Orbilia oligospora]